MAALIVVAVLTSTALGDALFHLRPIAAEKFWIAALRFGVTPLQEEAIFRLRNYPTRSSAVALVGYIRAQSRGRDLRSAARATETLCILSGLSFGTAFKEHARGHFWNAPDAAQWPELVERIEAWAERSFGPAR